MTREHCLTGAPAPSGIHRLTINLCRVNGGFARQGANVRMNLGSIRATARFMGPADTSAWIEQLLGRVGVELGLDPVTLLLAWARVAPAVALVPALALRGLPPLVRVGLGFALAWGVAPAVALQLGTEGPASVTQGGGWFLGMLWQGLLGLPVAVAAAVALWAASMAGGLVDDLRQSPVHVSMPGLDSGATPMGALLGLLAAMIFLEAGGVTQLAYALMRASAVDLSVTEWLVGQLLSGLQLAFAMAAPLVGASLVLEIVGAIVTRSAAPAFMQPLVSSFKSLALLGATALLLELMAELLAGRIKSGF